MCRSIKKLRNAEQTVSAEEVHQAALQFVRKISGFQKPSAANRETFDRAVDEIAESAERLLSGLVTRNSPAA